MPTGVPSLFVTLEGGGGFDYNAYQGGSGALVSGDMNVMPGESLFVLVGAGAANGVGSAGRSAIQYGLNTPDIVDAGAGGSSQTDGMGGNGGLIGDSGGGPVGGGGGTQSSGGAGGPGYAGYPAGIAGSQYHGGFNYYPYGGDGSPGGDGYFGGGAGGNGSAGGGGSSLTFGFAANSPDPITVIDGGAHNGGAAYTPNIGGDGLVEIQYISAPVPESSTTVSLGLLLALGMGGLVVAKKRRKA